MRRIKLIARCHRLWQRRHGIKPKMTKALGSEISTRVELGEDIRDIAIDLGITTRMAQRAIGNRRMYRGLERGYDYLTAEQLGALGTL